MKKFTKVGLIITAALFCMGVAFCSIAMAVGGGWKAVHENALAGNYNFGNWHFEDGAYYSALDWVEWMSGIAGKSSKPGGNEHCTDTFSVNDISCIQMELDQADIEIVRGKDAANIVVSMEKGYLKFFSAQLNGNTLYIRYDEEQKFYKNGPKITVEVPDHISLSQITVDTAMGDIRFRKLNLNCEVVNLNTAMGDVTAEEINLSGELSVYSAMGDVEISGGSCQNADAESAMGNVYLEGVFMGNVTAVTSMGDIDAELTGCGETYYNYDLSCDMGDLEFNGRDYTKNMGANVRLTNKEAKAEIFMKSNMGNIMLEVEK